MMSDSFATQGYGQEKRRPGRPTNAEIEARKAREEAAAIATAEESPPQPTKRSAETQATRRRRRDDGPSAGLKLHVPSDLKEEGFEYRWVNDDGRRIHDKTVMDDWDQVGTKGIDGQGEGSAVKRVVGKGEAGQPIYAYLCRKPTEFYREDKAKEQRQIDEREKAIKHGAPATPEGLSGPQTYIPDRHEGYSSDKSGRNRIGD